MLDAQASYAKSKLVTKNRLYSEAAAGPWARPEELHAKKHKAKESMRKSRTHIPHPDALVGHILSYPTMAILKIS